MRPEPPPLHEIPGRRILLRVFLALLLLGSAFVAGVIDWHFIEGGPVLPLWAYPLSGSPA